MNRWEMDRRFDKAPNQSNAPAFEKVSRLCECRQADDGWLMTMDLVRDSVLWTAPRYSGQARWAGCRLWESDRDNIHSPLSREQEERWPFTRCGAEPYLTIRSGTASISTPSRITRRYAPCANAERSISIVASFPSPSGSSHVSDVPPSGSTRSK